MALATFDRFDFRKATREIVNLPKEYNCHKCPRDFFLGASLVAHLESAHNINQNTEKVGN